MARFSGADEVVVRDLRRIEDRLEAAGDLADELMRVSALGFGGLLNLEAILIRADLEENVLTTHPKVTSGDIAREVGQDVPDMWNAIHIRDRGTDGRLLRHESKSLPAQSDVVRTTSAF